MWAAVNRPTLTPTESDGQPVGSRDEVIGEVLGYSVMHTGTSFLTHLVASAGFRIQHNHAHGDAAYMRRHNLRSPLPCAKVPVTGPGSIFLPERKDLPLVIPVRHPYDVVETWWQRGLELECLRDCYEELFEHQDRFNYLEFFVTADTHRARVHQMRSLASHLELDEVPEYWLEIAVTWNKVASQPHKKEPYAGDKSFVDFAVDHYGF